MLAKKKISEMKCEEEFIYDGQVCWVMGEYMIIRGEGRIKYMDESHKSHLLFGNENFEVFVNV
jgi:hypothetical protein